MKMNYPLQHVVEDNYNKRPKINVKSLPLTKKNYHKIIYPSNKHLLN